MNDIAAAAGLAKGTLYLYFRTREEIFLALLMRELSSWFAGFAEASNHFNSPEAALDWIASSLASRNALLHLGALLHAVLERNLPVETARAFKLEVEAGLCAIAPAVAHALRLESENEARRFLRWLQASIVGLHQVASPTPAVRAAIAGEPRLAGLAIDFPNELRAMLGALLSGMRQKERFQ